MTNNESLLREFIEKHAEVAGIHVGKKCVTGRRFGSELAHAHNGCKINATGEVCVHKHCTELMGWICAPLDTELFDSWGEPSNTLRHELAHLMVPGQAHTAKWRAVAKSMDVNIERWIPMSERNVWDLTEEFKIKNIYSCGCWIGQNEEGVWGSYAHTQPSRHINRGSLRRIVKKPVDRAHGAK